MGPGPGVFYWLEIGERRKILQSKLRNVRPEKKSGTVWCHKTKIRKSSKREGTI